MFITTSAQKNLDRNPISFFQQIQSFVILSSNIVLKVFIETLGVKAITIE